MLCRDTWIKLCAWLSLGMAPAVYLFFLKGTNKKCGEHRCNKETKKLSLYPHTLQNKAC